jgi:hypothetical protein
MTIFKYKLYFLKVVVALGVENMEFVLLELGKYSFNLIYREEYNNIDFHKAYQGLYFKSNPVIRVLYKSKIKKNYEKMETLFPESDVVREAKLDLETRLLKGKKSLASKLL